MSHYATLNEYRFEGDADDIRGARLYGEGGQELGHVRDIVFDHATGDIGYLVIGYGRERRVLLPVDRVFRTVTDEDSFRSELTSEDLDHLPAFDERVLKNDRQWRDYQKLHRSSLGERRRAEPQSERQWTEGPVQHRDAEPGITPAPEEESRKLTSIDRGHSDDWVPDVWPQRMAPVFGDRLGPRWSGFAERMKRDLHRIRGECPRCEEQDARAA
jgi:hypothetical protein